MRTYHGSFEDFRLDFTPEPPRPKDEWSMRSANYSTELANVHVYLDGEDVAAKIPSGYLQWILAKLLANLTTIMHGGAATVDWVSDPWQFDLRGDPNHDRVWITLQLPKHWVAMEDVDVPLSQFAQQVIELAYRWRAYLDSVYHDEMVDPTKGKDQDRFNEYLRQAEQACRNYVHP